MDKRKEPRYAPGQELTVHPGDPVNGAELLEDNTGEQKTAPRETPVVKRRQLDRYY